MTVKDVNLFYFGGSGGFYIFYQLLLTDQFVSMFENEPYDVRKAIAEQFDIKITSEWKKKEKLPDNTATLELKTTTPKLFMTFFVPSGVVYTEWLALPGTKAFVYTDCKSHIRLASAKNAGWAADRPLRIDQVKRLLKSSIQGLIKEVFFVKKYIEQNNGITIRWQDALTKDGLNKIFKQFDVTANQDNFDFMEAYIKLHPEKLLCKVRK